MLLHRLAPQAREVVRSGGGELVKIEADSLLLRYPDVAAACAGVQALEALLRRFNARRPRDDRLQFSHGIGFGDVLVLERDMFGVEVNLASKIGEDLARPGQVLLTPAAAAALPAGGAWRARPHATVTFGRRRLEVYRLRPRRR
jgi:adenylate cyclase